MVGLHGALANNTYVIAEALQHQGIPTIFITESTDTFPFSQPVWEDISFTLAYEQIHSNEWTIQKWKDCEKALNWRAPKFLLQDQLPKSTCARNKSTAIDPTRFNTIERLLAWLIMFRKSPRNRHIVTLMQKADVWVVCGINATLLAWLSGKPFVIWPHGGDIRFAAGHGFKLRNLFGHELLNELRRWLLRQAYSKACYIGTHDPTGIAGHVMPGTYDVDWFPIPHPNRETKLHAKDRHYSLAATLKELGVNVPSATYYIFIPSRIDFFWKGTDRLFDAIRKVMPKHTAFIFSGWGLDYPAVSREFSDHPLLCFLPCSVSKPILYRLFAGVDLVVDQFLLGSYGTSAVEAMSCGTPVMMHIADKAFHQKGWMPPPVINVSTSEEIASVLNRIDNGLFDFEPYRKATLTWFQHTHDEKVAVPLIMKRIHESLGETHV